jgi:laminin alpha 3/5
MIDNSDFYFFAGYFRYPDCIPCSCDMHGSLGLSCDQTTGQCVCKSNFIGNKCQECAPGIISTFLI